MDRPVTVRAHIKNKTTFELDSPILGHLLVIWAVVVCADMHRVSADSK
jgi:hypothetical protein